MLYPEEIENGRKERASKAKPPFKEGTSLKKKFIRRYGYRVVLLHWLIILAFVPLALTGIMQLRDWIYHRFEILGGSGILTAFDGAAEIHVYSGIALVIIGCLHLILHIRQKELPIISKHSARDMRSTLHTILYIFFLASRDERGSQGKYKENQRIAYIATVFTLGLSGITAFMIYIDVLGEMAVLIHILSGVLVLIVFAYRMLYLLRRSESAPVKCIMTNGKIPVWYAKKHHLTWFKQMLMKGEVPGIEIVVKEESE